MCFFSGLVVSLLSTKYPTKHTSLNLANDIIVGVSMSMTRELQEKWCLQLCDPSLPLAQSFMSFFSPMKICRLQRCLLIYLVFPSSQKWAMKKVSVILLHCLKIAHNLSFPSDFIFKWALHKDLCFPVDPIHRRQSQNLHCKTVYSDPNYTFYVHHRTEYTF